MMLVYLPNPVTCQVKSADGGRVEFGFHDPLHADAFGALMERAVHGGYAVQVRLVHYEGHPTTIGQARERREKKAKNLPPGKVLPLELL